MKRIKFQRGGLLALFAGVMSFALLSWDFKQQPGSVYIDKSTDTIPVTRDKKIRDLDDVLRELEQTQIHLNKDLQVNLEKMQKEINESFKNLDLQKIQLDIERSMKDVDFDKIRLDIEKSMKDVDFDKIRLDIEKSMKDADFDKIQLDFEKNMKEIDFDKLKLEIDESMAKIDWNKLKTELDKVREIDFSQIKDEMKKVEVEMSKIGPEIERSMEKAKVEIEKVREEMKEYNSFVDQLEKDGLLKRSEGYTLKHKDGELFINGKKQSAEVYNKYRTFLDKHKSFNITKSDDDFDMDID